MARGLVQRPMSKVRYQNDLLILILGCSFQVLTLDIGLWTCYRTLDFGLFGRLECSTQVETCGPIAQLVEQLAFNQWVAGSSPARLTTIPHQTTYKSDIEAMSVRR